MKKRILVIEDDIDIIELVNMILTRAGYEVTACENGRDAIAAIKQIRPHLILLDLMLPGMDGKSIVNEMSKDEEINSTSVLILSALEAAEQMFIGNPQIKGFCFKPFSPNALLDKVKKVMGD